ncbi:MAG TPA: hypothetical protein VFZ53_10890 [Polyangiaceae bacterium]
MLMASMTITITITITMETALVITTITTAEIELATDTSAESWWKSRCSDATASRRSGIAVFSAGAACSRSTS